MNCKPGDLAVIIGGFFPENYGNLVMVMGKSEIDGKDWEIELLQHTRTYCGGTEVLANPGEIADAKDGSLRPIRYQKGKDETLTWAPKKVTA